MSVLVDTNLLTRSLQPTSPHFTAATLAIRELTARGERLCVVPQPQVLYEFWTVCTRPTSVNGLGMATAQAAAEQARLLSLFALLPDGPAVFHEWQRLVVTHDVKGRNAHDARLVAAMTVHGLHRLLTFNAGDFARFPGLTVLAPEAFLPTVSP